MGKNLQTVIKKMTDNTKIQKLNEKVFVVTGSEHSFGTDAFLLAWFAGVKKGQTVCDLGTGCGIIPMIMAKDCEAKTIYGIDIQEKAIEQFKESIKLSEVETELIAVNADLKKLDTSLNGKFDIVTCNPPYKAANSGIESKNEAERIARHEICCNQLDVCSAASKILKFGGRLCICQRPERLADVIAAMRESGIEPKRLKLVCREKGDTPWLFLIEGKKGANPHLVIEKEFAVYENGEYTQEAKALYKGCFGGKGE